MTYQIRSAEVHAGSCAMPNCHAYTSPYMVLQELGANFEISDEIPQGMEDQVRDYREALLEGVVEMDDEAMEAYLEVGAALAGQLVRTQRWCRGRAMEQPVSKNGCVLHCI